MSVQNRLDPSGAPARLSTNLGVDRQTPKSDFGDLVQNGLSSAVGGVSSGLSMAAPFLSGGAIVSAAVSSLGATARPALTNTYASTGVTPVGGGPINTTVGNPATGVGPPGVPAGTGVGAPTVLPNGIGTDPSGGMLGTMNSGLAETAADLGAMLQVQMQVQRENQVFSTVSNVLKTRHDTIKNTISNVH